MSIKRSPTRQLVGSACSNTLREPPELRTVYSNIPGASSRFDSIRAQCGQRTACAVASSNASGTSATGASMRARAGAHAWSAVPAALKRVAAAAAAKRSGQSGASICHFTRRLSAPNNGKSVRQRTYPRPVCALASRCEINRGNTMGVLNKASARMHGAVDDIADAAAPVEDQDETLSDSSQKLLESAGKYVAAH